MSYEFFFDPRESGKFIAQASTSVSILTGNVLDAAKQVYEGLKELRYSCKVWREWPLHPKSLTGQTVDWIFVVDCLNFSFWLPGEKQFELEYRGKVYQDYEALCAAINRALDEEIPITTPSFYASLTHEQLSHIFRSSNGTVLPLIEQRLSNLREAGLALAPKRFKNSFATVVARCDKSARKLIREVLTMFPSFRDEGRYFGRSVSFHKRVQILVADIWACFEGEGLGEFTDISHLTMFADYRVPQALLSLNLLSYSDELMERLRAGSELPAGSNEEMEIRGCSIHAVELLRQALMSLMEADGGERIMVNSVIIDFYLWDSATKHKYELRDYPEHRTRSVYY